MFWKVENYEKFSFIRIFQDCVLRSTVLNILEIGLSRTGVSKFADDSQGFRILKAGWRESQKYLLIPKDKIEAEAWFSQI